MSSPIRHLSGARAICLPPNLTNQTIFSIARQPQAIHRNVADRLRYASIIRAFMDLFAVFQKCVWANASISFKLCIIGTLERQSGLLLYLRNHFPALS